ncbi:MAG: winged helix-turn-helix transcriptional regulator, partial [Muribaculum sp.]
PRTEYELTDLGRTLIPILNQLSEWGRNNLKEVKRNLAKRN